MINNQKVDKLAELASKSIQAGEAVWFGCDVSKFFSRKKGFLDLDLFGKDYHQIDNFLHI